MDGTTGENYEALKTINREFVALASELAPLKFSGAWAQGMVPRGVEPYCGKALLTISPATQMALSAGDQFLRPYADTTLVTRFDAPGRQTHLMVVNLDYRKARTIHVAAPVALERFDVISGIWSPVGSTQADLALPKGGGALLRFAKPRE